MSLGLDDLVSILLARNGRRVKNAVVDLLEERTLDSTASSGYWSDPFINRLISPTTCPNSNILSTHYHLETLAAFCKYYSEILFNYLVIKLELHNNKR